jgi:hypothetical protein
MLKAFAFWIVQLVDFSIPQKAITVFKLNNTEITVFVLACRGLNYITD